MATTKLERDTSNKVFFGVASGLANYLDVDVALVRVGFVLLCFAGGVGFIAYLALIIFMPEAPTGAEGTQTPTDVTEDDDAVRSRRRAVFGGILVIVGAALLLANLGAFNWIRWDVLWPLILIAFGVALFALRTRHG